MQVVIANGSILHASNDSHPDLYWALRGGGNNFGLVTKFNLYTIPSPMMYGGPRVFPANSFPSAINAFVNVAKNSVVDPHAQQLLTFFRVFGQNRAIAELSYTKDDADPEIFRQYREIPAVSDSTKSMTLYEYADYLDQLSPFHLREVYWPVVVQLNEKFANWVMTTFYEMALELDGMSAQPVIVYQAITVPMLAKMNNFGGNPLGLNASGGPLHLMHVACWWYDETEDDKIYETINSFWDKVISKAEDEGIYNEFIYMNYASMFQDPISSYGVDNKHRLNRIANKYDPKGVFRNLQPGYFKIKFPQGQGTPNKRFLDRKLTASQWPKMDWGSEKGLIPSLILFAWVFFPDALNMFPNERRDVI